LKAANFPGLDIDVLDEGLATDIERLAVSIFGPATRRIGQPPKRVLMYRLADGQPTMGRRRLWFVAPNENRPWLVELLGDGQQFVVEGPHPRTGKPYAWDGPHPVDAGGAGALSPITAEQAERFYDDLQSMLEARGCVKFSHEDSTGTAADRALVNQQALLGPSPDAVDAAVRAIPNDNAVAPTRTDYLRIGYAIKSALADDPDRAEAVWSDWAMRWTGNDRFPNGNDAETVADDWRRMKGPYAIGWNYLREHAVQAGAFVEPDEFHDNVLTAASLDEATGAMPERVEYAPMPKRLPQGLAMQGIALRPWVLGTRYMQGAVTTGIGAPGVGKSAMSILTGLAIATGRADLTGETVHRPGRVWIHNNEDPHDEMLRRIFAICHRYDIPTDGDLFDRFMFSTADRPGHPSLPFRVAEKLNDKVRATGAVDEVHALLRSLDIVFLSVDPLVSTHSGVSENDNPEIERVLEIFRSLAARNGIALDIVHHTVKNHSGDTEARAGDIYSGRGATSLPGAVRAAYTLAPMSTRTAEDYGVPDEDRVRLVRMDKAKGNYAPGEPGPRWFKLESIALMNDPTGETPGDSVGVPVHLPQGLSHYEEAFALRNELADAERTREQLRALAAVLEGRENHSATQIDLKPLLAQAWSMGQVAARERLMELVPVDSPNPVFTPNGDEILAAKRGRAYEYTLLRY
jgi:hypothetical protein